jgi:capsular polysaccharide export protein
MSSVWLNFRKFMAQQVNHVRRMKLPARLKDLFTNVRTLISQQLSRLPKFKPPTRLGNLIVAETPERATLNASFAERMRNFFRRKKPSSKCYPFQLEDPYEIFGDSHPYAPFYLVGNEWRNKESKKTVALLWGFNHWKFGFVSAYLKEYRTAFAPRKMSGVASRSALRSFERGGVGSIIIWGYNEPYFLLSEAHKQGIPVFRMEDGFLRSAELGAAHTTPYSLVLDSRGLYYNPENPSDIEEILNHHSFSEKELADGEYCMGLMQELRLSKYNPAPTGAGARADLKLRRRVAVIGQVKNDRSVQMGNINNWSEVELVRLAKHENPGAEILYRPHPDVYRGFQRNVFRKKSVEKFCTLSPPDGPLPDFLDEIDHVYVITSLAGLEALLRGIKVTIVGAAFYAGWGLTDDRLILPRRQRSRSLVEIFAATYLKYSKLLANKSADEVRSNFAAVCLRIKAEQRIATTHAPQGEHALNHPPPWPAVLFGRYTVANNTDAPELPGNIDYTAFLQPPLGRLYQQALAYAVCGNLTNNDARNKFLLASRQLLSPPILNSLLLDLHRHHPGGYVLAHLSWLLKSTAGPANSRDFLSEQLANLGSSRAINDEADLNNPMVDQASSEATAGEKSAVSTPDTLTSTLLTALAGDAFEAKDFKSVELSCQKMLLLDRSVTLQALYRLAKLSEQTFDRLSARQIAKLLLTINPLLNNRLPALLLVRSHSKQGVSAKPMEFLTDLALLALLKPDKLQDVLMYVSKFSAFYDAKFWSAVFKYFPYFDNEACPRKVAAFLALGDTARALETVEMLSDSEKSSSIISIAYSQTLSHSGRLDEARAETMANLKQNATVQSYQEALRVLVQAADYSCALEVLRDAQRRNLEIGDMYHRKVYFGSGLIKDAMDAFKLMPMRKAMQAYYPNKYYAHQRDLPENDSIIVFAVYGPGDEIRFASIYSELSSLLPHSKISITCDPRLEPLLKRSFPHFSFINVPRPRDSEPIDSSDYTRVKGADLVRLMNNSGADAIDRHGHAILVTDLLATARSERAAFPGCSYLSVNTSLAKSLASRLKTTVPLIGISWRSSLTTAGRNEHYLSVEDILPVFRLPGLRFINLQYDDCTDELAYIESLCPGRLIHFQDIDHYNDFESVAALMSCLDLVIAPATTVSELAGALGVKTLLLSNSSELWWRKAQPSQRDIWHASATHIEGDTLGDKQTLVDNLCRYLATFASSACSSTTAHSAPI